MVWRRNPFSRRYRLLDWDHAGPAGSTGCRVPASSSGARRGTTLGGFDRGYFMYMEDVDLCWRAGRRGWAVAYEPGAEVAHEQGVSADQHPYRMIGAHHLSLWRFARRSTAGWRRALLPVVAVGLVGRTSVAWAVRWSGGRARTRPAVAADPRNAGCRR